jgi:Cu/Zn superoxide dismutase
MKRYASIVVMLMALLILPAGPAMADEETIVITMHALTQEGTAEQIGTVTVSQTPHGLSVCPGLERSAARTARISFARKSGLRPKGRRWAHGSGKGRRRPL